LHSKIDSCYRPRENLQTAIFALFVLRASNITNTDHLILHWESTPYIKVSRCATDGYTKATHSVPWDGSINFFNSTLPALDQQLQVESLKWNKSFILYYTLLSCEFNTSSRARIKFFFLSLSDEKTNFILLPHYSLRIFYFNKKLWESTQRYTPTRQNTHLVVYSHYSRRHFR